MTEPEFLTVDEVLEIHADQLRQFGGSDGLRDRAALESAVGMAQSSYDGAFLHGNLFEMAAAYAFHIAQNQPFVDGNKRTGLDAALTFLQFNGWMVIDPESRLAEGVLAFADRRLNKSGFADLLRSLAQPAPLNP